MDIGQVKFLRYITHVPHSHSHKEQAPNEFAADCDANTEKYINIPHLTLITHT